MIVNAYKNKNGSVLISVLVVFTVLMVLGTAASALMFSEHRLAGRSYSQTQAYYLAKAGADICGSYIADNPDHLTNAQMDAFLDSLVAYGASSDTKLESTSEDYFNVTVTEDGDILHILSTGTVQPDVQASVTLTLEKEDIGLGLEAAVYINDDSLAQNSATINGDVVLTDEDAELTLENSAEVNGDIGVAEQVFPMPIFPSYPTGFAVSTETSPSVLAANTYYTNGLYYTGQNITVNVGNDDFVIRAKNFNLSQSSLTINRYGTGKFVLFIDPGADVVLVTQTSYFNSSGDPHAAMIYANIGNYDFRIRNSSILKSDMYIVAQQLMFENSTQYGGHIVFQGTTSDMGIEFENSSTIGETLIYAPNSYVLLENSFTADGTVIAGELEMENSSLINFTEIESSYLLDPILSKTAYFKRYYN